MTDHNRGSQTDLLAPGRQILSARAAGGYARAGGTSMAAPHVAGAFAVIRGALGDAAPTLDQMIQAMKDTGRHITDSTTGRTYVRLDVDSALERLRTPLPVPKPDDAVVGDFTDKPVVSASGTEIGTVIRVTADPNTGTPDRCLIDLGFQETGMRWVAISCSLLAMDTTDRVAISTLSETDLHALTNYAPVP